MDHLFFIIAYSKKGIITLEDLVSDKNDVIVKRNLNE